VTRTKAQESSLSIRVSIETQQLELRHANFASRTYPISTSKFGSGELRDSFRTPRGRHVVRAKIGAGEPLGAVFKARRPTGEYYCEALRREFPERDWILTRILWLSGTQIGVNRLGDVDTMRRYIYIHGCPDSEPLGVPGSIGCIRMANVSIAELFDLVSVGAIVDIV